MATLLQKDREAKLAYLERRVSELKLRFPVAAIADKTGYHKGHVSKILAGKSEISDEFIAKFDEHFPTKLHKEDESVELNNVKNSPYPIGVDATILIEVLKNSMKEYADKLMDEKEARRQEAQARLQIADKEKDKLFDLIQTNLTAIAKMLTSLARHDQAYHETMLRSLARLENRNESDLVLEAGTIEVNRME